MSFSSLSLSNFKEFCNVVQEHTFTGGGVLKSGGESDDSEEYEGL